MTAQNANGMGSLKSEILSPSRTTFDLSFLEVLRIRLGEEKKRKDYLHCRVDTKDLLSLSTFRWQLIHTANFGRAMFAFQTDFNEAKAFITPVTSI